MYKLAVFFLLSVTALVLAQSNWWQNLGWGSSTIDTIHGMRVQYDDSHDIVIFDSERTCYIVEAESDRVWDALLQNQTTLHTFTETVIDQIESGNGVASMTQHEASEQYHSRLEQWECRDKRLFKVTYTIPN